MSRKTWFTLGALSMFFALNSKSALPKWAEILADNGYKVTRPQKTNSSTSRAA